MLEKYEIIQSINKEHNVFLVKNIQDGSFYVKKILEIYDIDIYKYLYENNLRGVPFIKEYYEDDGKLTVIEEYISGQNLETILSSGKVFTEAETRSIIIKLCIILKQLTDHIPFVHRDIKPSNIIIKNNGDLYLVDFNISKLVDESKARDTILLGTEGYAAPEQYGFASSSVQTDIYAIGVLMKELLTGTNILNDYYNSSLKPVIEKCTKIDPLSRYQNYDELIKDINNERIVTDFHKYAFVGFRSDKLWIKVFAFLWYVFIIVIAFNLTSENATGFKLFFDRVGFAIAFISMTLFAGNYMGCHEKLSIKKEWNMVLRIVLITVLDILLGLSIIIFTLIIESLL